MSQSRSVLHLLSERIASYLQDDLRDHVDVEDETRAGLVREGLLQDDPTRYKVTVMVHINDPDDETGWRHEVLDGQADGKSFDPPGYMIGGGQIWNRRFTLELEMFFKARVKRPEALDLASVVLSRAEMSLQRAPINVGVDDFGEIPTQLRVNKSHLSQGGSDGSFIYHGKVWFTVMTEKEPPAF
jgi:hypothetical protein